MKYCDEVTCGVDHDVVEELCLTGYVTSLWHEHFTVQPLQTTEQRMAYRSSGKLMGRGVAAAVFETVALCAAQIERWLCIADAVERLAMNSPEEDYMELVIKGFDEAKITGENAVFVLLEVSEYGTWGGWPSRDVSQCEQFLRDVGAAIRTMINPAWSSDLRARLEVFRINDEEEHAERRARR